MPVTLTPYHDDESILIYTLAGTWSWEEFFRVDKIVWDRFEQSDERLDLIFDLTSSKGIPLGINRALSLAGRRTAPVERGLGIVVNAPPIARVIIRILRRVYPKAAQIYRFVDTLEEAIELIEKHRLSKIA